MPKHSVTTTRAKAQNEGTTGLTTQSHKIIVSAPFMEILIGGTYTDLNNEAHTYGHAALHVMTLDKDLTYDFGRYGKTWGAFDSEGDGVLNVWSVFKKYISGENRLKRTTTGYIYYLELKKAKEIIAYFDALIASKKEIRNSSASMQRYVLQHDYHSTINNCTTITLEAAKRSGKRIVNEPEKYQEMRGLSWTERQAARTQGWSADGIFMPADLQAMLEGNRDEPYDKKNIYQ